MHEEEGVCLEVPRCTLESVFFAPTLLLPQLKGPITAHSPGRWRRNCDRNSDNLGLWLLVLSPSPHSI